MTIYVQLSYVYLGYVIELPDNHTMDIGFFGPYVWISDELLGYLSEVPDNHTLYIRVFGNAQTLSWTSGEAICAVYMYEKDNYQKTRGQNSKF